MYLIMQLKLVRFLSVNVLAPHFEETLCEDIGELKDSFLIDETTDISVTKMLRVLVS